MNLLNSSAATGGQTCATARKIERDSAMDILEEKSTDFLTQPWTFELLLIRFIYKAACNVHGTATRG
jgi:hypothetical protein